MSGPSGLRSAVNFSYADSSNRWFPLHHAATINAVRSGICASRRADLSTLVSMPSRSPRPPDRAATEAALQKAALSLVERNGVLAGLNLREVAEEAGVNRGLV